MILFVQWNCKYLVAANITCSLERDIGEHYRGLQELSCQETSKKLLSLNSTLRQTPLCTYEADMLLPVYIHPGHRYIFAGTTFDEDTCKVLDRLFLPIIKSKMGYTRTTKMAIMHGSYRYGGAQPPTCWDLQGSTHLSMFIGHLQQKDIVGQYLLHEMDYL